MYGPTPTALKKKDPKRTPEFCTSHAVEPELKGDQQRVKKNIYC